MKLAGSIKIDIPLTAKGWLCKFKGHEWTRWKEIDSTAMTRACQRCGLIEHDKTPEKH